MSFYLVALFVDTPVVPPTQHRQVRQRRRAAVRPMADVMTLTQRQSAAGGAATTAPMLQYASERRRNGSRSGAVFLHMTVSVGSHHHAGRLAPQAARRFLEHAA